MGRPISDRYFGNRDLGNVGGKSVTAVALGTAGTGYSQGLTATVSLPQIASGVRATVTPVVNPATGAITSYTVTNGGGGYSSATVTLVPAATVTPTGAGTSSEFTITVSNATGIYAGMGVTGTGVGVSAKVTGVVGLVVTVSVANASTVSGTITFTDVGASGVPGTVTVAQVGEPNQTYSPAISLTALTVGATPRANSDIVKQKGSRRYLVQNQDGSAICKLVAATPAIGQASLVATDSLGKTYYVTKLTEHKALLTQSGSGPWQFATGVSVGWTFGTPVLSVSVQIASM